MKAEMLVGAKVENVCLAKLAEVRETSTISSIFIKNNLGFHLRYPFSGNFDDYSGFQPKVTPQKNFSRQCSRQNGYRTVTELIQKGHSSVKEWSHNGHKMVTERSKTVTGQSQDRHKTVTEHRMVTEGSEKGHRMATG